MKDASRAAALTLLVIVWNVPIPAAGQEAAAPAPVVTLTPAQMEEFLRSARIVSRRDAEGGITNTQIATLSDGTLTHDAQIQTIDQRLARFKPPEGPEEFNFKDSYRYNVAAYRLAALLDLDNVPMSVERTVDTNRSGATRAAVTWWIDDVMMDDRARLKTVAPDGPDPERTAMQIYIMRVFDELIANRDRNLGNLLWTSDWKMWMIDHTRAFRLDEELRRPATLLRIERSLFTNLQGLTTAAVTQAVGRSLSRFEIQSLLSRRDAIVELFEAKIAARGEVPILYALPR